MKEEQVKPWQQTDTQTDRLDKKELLFSEVRNCTTLHSADYLIAEVVHVGSGFGLKLLREKNILRNERLYCHLSTKWQSIAITFIAKAVPVASVCHVHCVLTVTFVMSTLVEEREEQTLNRPRLEFLAKD